MNAPQPTRDENFNRSIGKYFSESVLFRNDIEDFTFEMRSTTNNKRKKTHTYTISIPWYVELYTIEKYTDRNGLFHHEETKYGKQNIPEPTVFAKDFYGYYSPYFLFENNKTLSSVTITNICANDGDSHYIIYLKVNYYKNHIPYPINTQNNNAAYLLFVIHEQHNSNNRLHNEVEYLRHSLFSTNDHYNRACQKLEETEKCQVSRLDRMKNKIYELCKQSNQYEDCPVCLESMNDKNFMVSDCCHEICKGCFSKCSRCPICRAVWINESFSEDEDIHSEDEEQFNMAVQTIANQFEEGWNS